MSTYRIESIRHESTQTGLTLEEASKFLRLAPKTTEEKAIYHEPVRGAWYVFREQESEPVLLPKERITKTGFLETEWAASCVYNLPSAQPSFPQRHENDCISRMDAIDAVRDNESENYITINNLIDKDVVVELLEDLPSAQPEQRWIPVTERLPEVGKDVMVCYDFKGHRSVLIGVLYGDETFHGYDDEYLTPEGRKYRKAVAWMPLPEPYRKEGEQE